MQLLTRWWIALIILLEIVLPAWYIVRCSFPQLSLADTHGLLVADPQLTDYHSYSHNGLLLLLEQFYCDHYMRRNWRLLLNKAPSFVVFLGDLMDGGRELDSYNYKLELLRFRRIFKLSYPLLTIGVPGNHDIGFGNTVVPKAYDVYAQTFGTLNQVVQVANHSFICLDTVSLSATVETPQKLAAQAFLDQLAVSNRFAFEQQNILLTHVPLYRPPASDCGPIRTRPPIVNAYGHQYQSI